jgi:hypothetical protein
MPCLRHASRERGLVRRGGTILYSSKLSRERCILFAFWLSDGDVGESAMMFVVRQLLCCYMFFCWIVKPGKFLAVQCGTEAKGHSAALSGGAMPRWPSQEVSVQQRKTQNKDRITVVEKKGMVKSRVTFQVRRHLSIDFGLWVCRGRPTTLARAVWKPGELFLLRAIRQVYMPHAQISASHLVPRTAYLVSSGEFLFQDVERTCVFQQLHLACLFGFLRHAGMCWFGAHMHTTVVSTDTMFICTQKDIPFAAKNPWLDYFSWYAHQACMFLHGPWTHTHSLTHTRQRKIRATVEPHIQRAMRAA